MTTGNPCLLIACSVIVWCYNGIEKGDLWTIFKFVAVTATWLGIGDFVTSRHLWWLQCHTVTWSRLLQLISEKSISKTAESCKS